MPQDIDTAQVMPQDDGGAFVLTNDNYYSEEANRRYMSNSLFKDLYGHPGHPMPCQAAALYGGRKESQALLIGSYVDSWFEGPDSFRDFKDEHMDQLMTKNRKDLYQFVKDADTAIERVSRDSVFMRYMAGSHQTVMTGVIAGHPFKIKMDSYHPGEMIVDLKYVKSAEDVWNPVLKRRVTFIEDYGYFIQGAVYREVVRQNTGLTLPFFIAFITKDDVPDYGVVEIPEEMLDSALLYVEANLTAMPYAMVMQSPRQCHKRSCVYCRSKKSLTGPMSYMDFEKYAAS